MNDENTHEKIENWLSAHSHSEVPPAVKARLERRLEAFRKRLCERGETTEPGSITAESDGRIIRKTRLAWGLSAAALIIMLGIVFTTWNPDSSRLYASIVDQLRNLLSLSYTIELAPGTEVTITYRKPGKIHMRTSWGLENIIDETNQKEIIILHTMNGYILKNEETPEIGEIFLDDLRNLPDRADIKLGKRIVDGKKLTGFRVMVGENYVNVWIDHKSKQLARVNIDFHHQGSRVHSMAIKNIRFNDPVNDSLFNFEPPEGYKQLNKAEKEDSYNIWPKMK